VKRRLTSDSETGKHPAGNRDFELWVAVKGRFEAIPFPKAVIDTSQDLEECICQALPLISK